MFISVCGFGSTGSSAVSDYLRECENMQVFDRVEFTISASVDGLEDLEYFLMNKNARQTSSIYAIQRFERLMTKKAKKLSHNSCLTPEKVVKITQNFLDTITQVKYVGLSPRINRNENDFILNKVGYSLIHQRIMKILERKGIIKENIDYYPLDTVRMAIKPPNFYEAAQSFVNELLSGLGFDLKSNMVFDQAFSGADPAKSFPFFPDPYAIVVDRDPRDIYIFAKKKLFSNGRFMPSKNVEDFIEYYRLLRENQPYKNPNPRILCIRFEDMIYDYENTITKINRFLNVKNNRSKTVFKPELSVANTNLISRFPEFEKDVRKIEHALPEYIYPFEKYPNIKNSGKMFYGRALRPR